MKRKKEKKTCDGLPECVIGSRCVDHIFLKSKLYLDVNRSAVILLLGPFLSKTLEYN